MRFQPHYSARLHGAIRALEDRRDAANQAAAEEANEARCAMLRGKYHAYIEAIDLLRAVEEGRNLPRRLRWTDRRKADPRESKG